VDGLNVEQLSKFPAERIIYQLDNDPEIQLKQIQTLKTVTTSFILKVTEAINIDQIKKLTEAAKPASINVIAEYKPTIDDIIALDKLNIELQTELYDGLSPTEALIAILKSDRPDGYFTTVVVDEYGVALGLCYSNKESLTEAIKTKKGVYWSRSRGLWRKGETSGAVQELIKITVDCDRDTLRFMVKQQGQGFCHLNTWTCFGPETGIPKLSRTLESRKVNAPPGSYTKRLFDDANLLQSKLLEEVNELIEAKTKEEIAWEAADVIYFTMVYCIKNGVSLADVETELERRSLKITRRPGNAKPTK